MKLNYRFKSFIISTIFIGLQAFLVCSQEKQQITFKPEIVTEQDNFNEKYFVLAQGFSFIGQDFQSFMMQKMLGHDSHEMVADADGQIIPLLDNTLMQAQEEIKKSIGKPFCDTIFDAIKNNTDLNDIQNPIFGYALKTEFLEPELKTYVKEYSIFNPCAVFCTAIDKNNSQVVQFLIDIGVDVNEPIAHMNWAPLHYSVTSNDSQNEITHLLLRAGANINQLDKSGQTPLHLAVNFNIPHFVQVLLAAGADMTLRDFNHRTAIELLRKRYFDGEKLGAESVKRVEAIRNLFVQEQARRAAIDA